MVLSTAYFPTISYIRHLQEGAAIEAHENFVKQSQRNRCEVLSDKGIQILTVPISWCHGQKMPIRDVRIDYTQPWQRITVRALQSYYASAPYFDHYFHRIRLLLERRDDFLFDLNTAITEQLLDMLNIDLELKFTEHYTPQTTDLPPVDLPEYYQVFSEKLPFAPDLSILDYLFCEGRWH